MAFPWLAVAGMMGAGATAYSAYSASQMSARTNMLQEELMDKQMNWQEKMSGSAHTREVQDLRNAGLNPVLSAGGSGATSPIGSMPVLNNPEKDLPGGVSSAVSSALSGIRNQQEYNLTAENIKTQQSIQAVNEAQSAKLKADALKSLSEADLTKVSADIRKSGYGKVLEGIDQTVSSAQGVIQVIKSLSDIRTLNERHEVDKNSVQRPRWRN